MSQAMTPLLRAQDNNVVDPLRGKETGRTAMENMDLDRQDTRLERLWRPNSSETNIRPPQPESIRCVYVPRVSRTTWQAVGRIRLSEV